MNLIFLIMKVKIDFRSIASIILNGGIYMNALTDIKSKIEKNKEEKKVLFIYISKINMILGTR